MTHVLDAVMGSTWAILPDALTTIIEIANRDNLDIAAVEAQLGRRLDNTHTVTTRDGVATIPVEGPIFRRADFFAEVSGATSVETLAQDLRVALDDPAVAAIVLAIDSPGGSVNGVGEFADMIYAARAIKPITAYVSHQGASAAYWIASAAGEVVVAPTALVGSIGVVAAVPDPTKAKARDIEFVSSQSPRKRPDPTTQAGASTLQATVDETADLFIADVARFRGVTPETVIADFGAGWMLMGQKAVDAHLADRVGTYEGVVAEAQAAARAKTATWPRVRTGATQATRTTPAAHGAGTSTGAAHDAAGQATNTRSTRMPLNWKFWEKTDAVERAELRASGVEGVPEEGEISAIDAEVERRVAAERAAFTEKLAVATAERLTAEATHTADTLIRAGKLMAAEREAYIGTRLRAAQDDATSPRASGPSRVADLDAISAARPSHGLFGERVASGEGKQAGQVLVNMTGEGNASDITTPAGARAAAKAWAEKANQAGARNGQSAH